eukprot:TRINITY_DN8069_c0_g1_i1.p2 TRINITY_DN8069_c0_g1~~TRINITY_DN8069_c0_g1_i1.p2  ORF type:complete len:123 (-),score=25.95 TRINITY_DN8069_c0_g1_i1:454-822(-)
MKDDMFHGHGVYTKPDGSGYKGEFVNGKKHGRGITFDQHGRTQHEGEYRDGMFSGFGHYFYAAGDEYEGFFREGLFHGSGKYLSRQGDELCEMEGEFEAGKLAKAGPVRTPDSSATATPPGA